MIPVSPPGPKVGGGDNRKNWIEKCDSCISTRSESWGGTTAILANDLDQVGSPGVAQGGTPVFVDGSLHSNDYSKLRKDLIHSQSSDTMRGFNPKTHNTPPKNLLLSDPEKQELLDKSDWEKKMMEDLRVALLKSNIPVKVIQNEQRIIIHAINILNNYDKGHEYEWAA